MKRHLRTWKVLLVLGAFAVLALPGCGSDEYSPDPVQTGSSSTEKDVDLAFRNLSDTQITSLELTTSQDYDPSADEVRIFALVKDQDGDFFPDLNQYNFTVVLQPKTAEKTVAAGDTTITTTVATNRVVALVIDSSGSMGGVTETGQTRMTVAKEAAKLFVALMAPGDQTAVVDFDSSARVVQALTDDQEALNVAIDEFTADGATNLGAAVTEAVRAIGTRPGKRAAILLTDGDDTVDSVTGGPDVWLNDSTSTRFQGLQLAQDNELVVYTVGLGTDLSETGLADLETFATETGGTFFQAPTAVDLNTAFGITIPAELDALDPVETYLLTVPNPVPKVPGKKIRVSLRIHVKYQNGIDLHRPKFEGSYSVQ